MDDRRLRWAGAVVFAGLVGFGVGNGVQTREAIDGSAKWWAGQQHKDLKGHLSEQSRKDWIACGKLMGD